MHAADLLKGTGMVEARDVSGRKTDLIEENIMRCGFRNIRTNVWDATVLDPSMVEQADVVLGGSPMFRSWNYRKEAGYQRADDER